uniref:Transmembrane protein n=1 Tax=Anopheles melas TaxID=34690 RepID=A0A182U306_9DIPT
MNPHRKLLHLGISGRSRTRYGERRIKVPSRGRKSFIYNGTSPWVLSTPLPSVPRSMIKVEGNFLRFFVFIFVYIFMCLCVCVCVALCFGGYSQLSRGIMTTTMGGMYRKMNGTHRTIERKYVLKSVVCV